MKRLLPIILLVASWVSSAAQQPLSHSAYRRAVSFLWDNVNNQKVFHVSVTPNWLADSTGFWFEETGRSGKTFLKVTFKPMAKAPLFDHAQLTTKLNETLKNPLDPKSLPLESLRYLGKELVEFSVQGRKFQFESSSGTLTEQKDQPKADANQLESKSPDGRWIAYAENYNLFVRSADGKAVKQLSTAGHKDYEYASYYGWSDIMEGEGGERPRHFEVRWSPDSRWIQASVCDLRHARKMYLLDWSVDTLYRARLLSYYRGSPGDTTVVHLVPVIFNVETGKEIRIAIPPVAHENGYGFEWGKQPGMGYADFRERGFQKAHVLQIDLNNNQQRMLVSDSSRTNVDGFGSWLLEQAGTLLFSSERSGWKQLYSADLKTRAVKPLTTGSWFVNSFVYADAVGEGSVYFLGSGREPGRNPYQIYFYRSMLSGKGLKLLTPEEGNHDVQVSPNHLFFVDNYSTPQNPTVSVLREMKTGKILMELSKADISDLVAMRWTAPEPFTALGKDGKSTIHGLLWKPSDFDPTRKYPLIDNSYTGPHTQIVPRTFQRVLNSNNQSLAELGFIVMMVDGLGTAGRSKEFHDYSYKRMGFNLEDHMRAIKQLSTQYAWIDATRVGIFGHSAGGFDAGHAVLQYPDFYKVAVASSADHDFRMEKAWWPEMYMGWPVDSAYQNQSNITMAGNLKGKLLITHGGIDENVNPSATFKLAEMLVRADKQFDMLIFPSQRHGYQGLQQKYFVKRRWNYFVEHLAGQTPWWDFAWK